MASLLPLSGLAVQTAHADDADASGCTVTLSVTSASPSISDGGQIHYTYTVGNSGTKVCNGTVISVYYASNETYVSSTPNATASGYYWEIGKLKPGQSYPISVVTKERTGSASSLLNEACATARNGSDACADTTITVTGSTSSGSTDQGRPADPGSGGQSSGSPDDSGSSSTPANPISDSGDTVTSSPTPQNPDPVQSGVLENGVWFWDSPYSMTWTRSKQLIDAAAANGFNRIYVTIDDYLPIVYALPAGVAKDRAMTLYESRLDQFLTYAHDKGIIVDAEAGWRDWAETPNQYKAYAVLDFVASYNASHAVKFGRMQYDVEPYLLPAYENDKGRILTDYVALVDGLVTRNVSAVPIQMVIPHFYDTAHVAGGWTPYVTYGGKTGSAFSLALSILDRTAGNSISIMAYRNHAGDDDGTIDLSQDEMNEANASGHQTKIIVAQETGDVDPSYVTFYGKSKSSLATETSMVKAHFSSSRAFAGMAVDYIDPFLQLK